MDLRIYEDVRALERRISNLERNEGGGSAKPTIVRKTADEPLASETLQNDDHLTLAIGANEIWVIEYRLLVGGTATCDFKQALSAPTGATGMRLMHGPALGITTAEGDGRWEGLADLTTAMACGLWSGLTPIFISATVVNGSTAGNVVLQWAQNTFHATQANVKANSHLVAHKVN